MTMIALVRPVAVAAMQIGLWMPMVFVLMIMIMIMIVIVIVIVLRGAVLVCHKRFSMMCEAVSCLRRGADHFNGDV